MEDHHKAMFELDLPRAEKLRRYIDSKIYDKSLAEKLKPWYGGWCKRPAFHDENLDIFNRENVTLIDTDGRGIERYSENGIVANGKDYEIDLIVFATGFTVAGTKGGCPSQQTRAPVIGRSGRNLEEKWLGSDFGTLFGSVTNEFPNYFIPGVNTPSPLMTNPGIEKPTEYYYAIADRCRGLFKHLIDGRLDGKTCCAHYHQGTRGSTSCRPSCRGSESLCRGNVDR